MMTIPGYRYSVGPILADENQKPIPGFRYSVGPVIAEEYEEYFALQPEIPPKAPTRKLTKRSPPPKLPSRPHDSFHTTSDSAIDVSSPDSPRANSMSYASSQMSRRATISSISSASSKHATMSSISSVESSVLPPLPEHAVSQKMPTLTPMSDGLALGPRYSGVPSPIEDRFVFDRKPKPIQSNSGWMGQFIDHWRQKSEAKQQRKVAKKQEEMQDSQLKSHMMFTEAREKRAMEKINNKTPIWLTTEEKKVIEDHRRQVLEVRLEKALRGRKYRIAHQIDGELKILGLAELPGDCVASTTESWRKDMALRRVSMI